MDTVQYSNVLYFKALGLMTCHTAVGIMNLRKNHSLKNLGACSVLDFPPGHEQCGDHRLHILKQGDNLVWQWDGKCEVSGWFLLQPISRVCLFPDMDAKYTIPELQRGKRVYREKMPCIMGDGAMGWVQTAGGGGERRGEERNPISVERGTMGGSLAQVGSKRTWNAAEHRGRKLPATAVWGGTGTQRSLRE